ncbi:UNVERIFIED_CONTAM: hypothetical protein ACS92_05455 [Bacillus cereus]
MEGARIIGFLSGRSLRLGSTELKELFERESEETRLSDVWKEEFEGCDSAFVDRGGVLMEEVIA